jgi:hypothetical protein
MGCCGIAGSGWAPAVQPDRLNRHKPINLRTNQDFADFIPAFDSSCAS